ncbi:MAG: hypothetical protein CMD43_03450 [Gammaproteobacteria bacterium]|nr:hypothetical protein [Gammaproteobacteria bacterium]
MSLSNSLKYASSILLIFIIIDHYGKHILQLLLSINISYIFIVILISTIQYILSAYRWMYISKYTNLNIDFYDSIKFYYISSFLNNILPGGIIGDIFRIYKTSENKNEFYKIGKSFQSVVFERLSGQLMLFSFFIISLTIYFLREERYLAFVYFLFPSILVYYVVRYFIKKRIRQAIQKKEIESNFFKIFTGEVFWRHFFISFFVILSYILIYMISAVSLGLEIDYLAFMVFSPIILFSMTLPISIGGWGVRELTALLVSLLIGLSASASISVSIIYGLINLICSLPGLYFLLPLKLR